MKNIFIFLLLWIPFFAIAQKDGARKFKLPLILEEVSGLYWASNNSLWWLNDGGHSPAIYQTDNSGKLLQTISLNITNQDWEDLTADDKGNIYIGDFGNNRNKRKNLKIYIYNQSQQSVDSISFKYPDQNLFPPPKAYQNFDMEAFLWHNGQLHLFSKNSIGVGNDYTKHYILSDQAGEQTALLKDSIYLKNRVVTAAAISPNGKTIALLSYTYRKIWNIFPSSAATLFFITDFEDTNFLSGKISKRGIPPFIIATQYESVDFIDDQKVYIASEKTAFIKAKAKRLKVKTKSKKYEY